MDGKKSSFSNPTDNKGKGSESIDSNERTTSRPNENQGDGSKSNSKNDARSAEIAKTLKGDN